MSWLRTLFSRRAAIAAALVTSLVFAGLLAASPTAAIAAQGPQSGASEEAATGGGDDDVTGTSQPDDVVTADDEAVADSPAEQGEPAQTSFARAQSPWCPPIVWPENPLGEHSSEGAWTDNNVTIYARDDAYFYNHEVEGVVYVEGDLTIDRKNELFSAPFKLGMADGGSGSFPSGGGWMLRVDGRLGVYAHDRWGVRIGGVVPAGNTINSTVPPASAGRWMVGSKQLLHDDGFGVNWAFLWVAKQEPLQNVYPFSGYPSQLDDFEGTLRQLQQSTPGRVERSGSVLRLIGDGKSAVQMFNVSASDASALANGGATVALENIPGGKGDIQASIVINVLGSSVLVEDDVRYTINGQGIDQPVSWTLATPAWGNLTERLMWRFPDAGSVRIGTEKTGNQRSTQFTGTIFAPAASTNQGLVINTPTNGRLISFGKLTINAGNISGQGGDNGPIEHHSFPFVWPGPLECEPLGWAVLEKDVVCDECTPDQLDALKELEFEFTATYDGKPVTNEPVKVKPNSNGWLVGPYPVGTQVCFAERTPPPGVTGTEWINHVISPQCVTVQESTPGDPWGTAIFSTATNYYKQTPAEPASLILKKQVDGQWADWTVGVNEVSGFPPASLTGPNRPTTGTDGNGNQWTVTFPSSGGSASVNVWEQGKDGYDFVSMSCSNQDGTVLVSQSGSMPTQANPTNNFPVNPGDEITCIFYNTKVNPGSMTLLKLVDGQPADWEVGVNKVSGFPPAVLNGNSPQWTGANGASWTVDFEKATDKATVNIWEKPQDGYNFQTLTCTEGGFTLPGFPYQGNTPTSGSASPNIEIKPGTNIICTFENVSDRPDVAEVVITKYTVDTPGGSLTYAHPADGWWTRVGTNDKGVTVGTNPAGAPTDGDGFQRSNNQGETRWTVEFPKGTNTAELNVSEKQQAGYEFLSGDCNIFRGGSYLPLVNIPAASAPEFPRTLPLDLQPGDQVSCRFFNGPQTYLMLQKFTTNIPGGRDPMQPGADWNWTAGWGMKASLTQDAIDKGAKLTYKGSNSATNGYYPTEGSQFPEAAWDIVFGDNPQLALQLSEESRDDLEFYGGLCEVRETNGISRWTNITNPGSFELVVKPGDQWAQCRFFNAPPAEVGPTNPDPAKVTLEKALYPGQDSNGNPTGTPNMNNGWELRLRPAPGSAATVTPNGTPAGTFQTVNSSGKTGWTVDFEPGTSSAPLLISEKARGGYELLNGTCTINGGAPLSIGKGAAVDPEEFRLNLQPGDNVTCRLNNAPPVQPVESSLYVKKEVCDVNGSNCTRQNWQVGLTQSSGTPAVTVTGTNPQQTGTSGNGATYTIKGTEGASAGVKLWEVAQGDREFKSLICENQEHTELVRVEGGTMPTQGSPSKEFQVKAGDTVTCTFQNKDRPVAPATGTITLHKTLGPAGGTLSSGKDWKLRLRGSGAVSVAAASATDADGFQTTNSSGDTTWNLTFPAGTGATDFYLSEKQQGDFSLRRAYCKKADGSLIEFANQNPTWTNEARVTLNPGDNITCTFFNEEKPPVVEGHLLVKKEVCDADGNNCVRKDWQVGLTQSSGAPTTTVTPAVGTDAQSTGVSGDGARWNISGPASGTASVKLWEVAKDDKDFKSLVCKNQSGSTLLNITGGSMPTQASPSDAFQVEPGDEVTCTFQNKDNPTTPPPTVTGQIRVHKQDCSSGSCKEINWKVGLKQVAPIGDTTVTPNYGSDEGATSGDYKRYNIRGPQGGTANVVLWEAGPPDGVTSDLEFKSLSCKYAAGPNSGNVIFSVPAGGSMPTAANPAGPFQVQSGDDIDCWIDNSAPAVVQPTATVTLEKAIYANPEATGNPTPGVDWELRLKPSNSSSASVSPEGFQKTNAQGQFTWEVDFNGASSTWLDLSEKMKAGSDLELKEGVCWWLNDNGEAVVTKPFTSAAVDPGFASFEFKPGDNVRCRFKNVPKTVTPPANAESELFVKKQVCDADGNCRDENWKVGLKQVGGQPDVLVDSDSGAEEQWTNSTPNGAKWTIIGNVEREAKVVLKEVQSETDPKDFQELTCVNTSTGQHLFAPIQGGLEPGTYSPQFTVKPGMQISCTFKNKDKPVPAQTAEVVLRKGTYAEAGGSGTVTFRNGWWLRLDGGTSGATVTPAGATDADGFQETKQASWTGGSGSASTKWNVVFPQGTDSAELLMSEKSQSGFKYTNGYCTITRDGVVLPRYNFPAGSAEYPNAIPLELKADDQVVCVIRNEPEPVAPPTVESSLYVKKEVCDADGNNCARKDWQVGLTQSSGAPAVTVTGANPQQTGTSGNGATYTIKGTEGASAGVKLWEVARDDKEFKSLVCTNQLGTELVRVEGGTMPTQGSPSKEFQVNAGDTVTCTFQNKDRPTTPEPTAPAKVQLSKLTCKQAGSCDTAYTFAKGWYLRLRPDDAAVEVTPASPKDTDSEGFQAIGSDFFATWEVDFNGKQESKFWVSEKQQPGYEFLKAECQITRDGKKLPSWMLNGNLEDPSESEVMLQPGDYMYCAVWNVGEPLVESQLFVKKEVCDADGNNCERKDWQVGLTQTGAETATAQVTPATGTNPQSTGTTGDGAKWNIVGPSNGVASVKLWEVAKDEKVFESLTCTNQSGKTLLEIFGGEMPLEDSPSDAFDVKPGDTVNCTFKNKPEEEPPPVTEVAKVTLQKATCKKANCSDGGMQAKDWKLLLESQDDSVKVKAIGSKDGDGFQTTAADGMTKWEVDFNGKLEAKFLFSEKQQLGFEWWRTSCFDENNGNAYLWDINGNPVFPSKAEVTLTPGSNIRCVAYNIGEPPVAQVTIEKLTYTDEDGTQGEQPGEGFQLGLAAGSSGATVSPSGFQTTGPDGKAKWNVSFNGKDSAELRLSEKLTDQQKDEWKLLGGACEITHLDGTTEPVVIEDDAVDPYFATVTFRPGDNVSCTLKNAKLLVPFEPEGPPLPMAGGTGVLIFIVLAGSASAAAIALAVVARKKRGRHSLNS